MRRKSRIVAIGGVGALVLAGIGCAVVFGGTLGPVLAFILIAAGLVLATSLVFLEVGLSEERERERERERVAGRRARPRAPRLGRSRGERRHLR